MTVERLDERAIEHSGVKDRRFMNSRADPAALAPLAANRVDLGRPEQALDLGVRPVAPLGAIDEAAVLRLLRRPNEQMAFLGA